MEAFKDFGYEVSFDKVRPLIGMGGDQVVPKLISQLSGESGEGHAIADRRKELIINKYAPNLPAANGSRQLLLKMKNEGLRLIIASSATSEELSLLLKAAQVDDLLEEATTSSDAESSKPSPDIVEAALKKLNKKPDEVVMLGDTPYDIQSAKSAGVSVIAVRCGGFDDSQLEGAIAIYNDPADILANYDNSPLSK